MFEDWLDGLFDEGELEGVGGEGGVDGGEQFGGVLGGSGWGGFLLVYLGVVIVGFNPLHIHLRKQV